jgi:hypothetical protein
MAACSNKPTDTIVQSHAPAGFVVMEASFIRVLRIRAQPARETRPEETTP